MLLEAVLDEHVFGEGEGVDAFASAQGEDDVKGIEDDEVDDAAGHRLYPVGGCRPSRR